VQHKTSPNGIETEHLFTVSWLVLRSWKSKAYQPRDGFIPQ
jgi:hypothetical protein